jgi:hypothetical protein
VAARLSATRGAALASLVAVVGTIGATAAAMTASDTFNVFRYTAPFGVAGVIFLAGTWLAAESEGLRGAGSWRRARAGGILRTALVSGAALAWLLVPVTVPVEDRHLSLSQLALARSQAIQWTAAGLRTLRAGLREPPIDGGQDYVTAQLRLPPGSRIVSAASRPFLWSFEDQVVHTLDCPGQASPPPGLPFFEGPEAVAGYFRELGYTHLAFTPPDVGHCLYSRERWKAVIGSGAFVWEQWAPYFLDFMENEELLWQSLGAVYESPELVVVDLRQGSSGSLPAGSPRR